MMQGIRCTCNDDWEKETTTKKKDEMQEIKTDIMVFLGIKGRKELYEWLQEIVEGEK